MTILNSADIWFFDENEERKDTARAWLFEPTEHDEGRVFHLDYFTEDARLTAEQAYELLTFLKESFEILDALEDREEFGEDYDEYAEARGGEPLDTIDIEPGDIEEPRRLYDETGRCVGTLMPLDVDAINASEGIQPWSKPGYPEVGAVYVVREDQPNGADLSKGDFVEVTRIENRDNPHSDVLVRDLTTEITWFSNPADFPKHFRRA